MFTKSSQGHHFVKMRDVIMGYEPISTLKREIFGIKEHVEIVMKIVITNVYNVSPGLGYTVNEHTKEGLYVKCES